MILAQIYIPIPMQIMENILLASRPDWNIINAIANHARPARNVTNILNSDLKARYVRSMEMKNDNTRRTISAMLLNHPCRPYP